MVIENIFSAAAISYTGNTYKEIRIKEMIRTHCRFSLGTSKIDCKDKI